MRYPSIFKSLALLSFLGISLSAHGATPTEGFEYQLIQPPVPTETGDKIEVVELFWYGCPHCYHFEPYIQQWLETKPDNVEFRRIPAVFNEVYALHARAFYTAEALGVAEKMQEPIFVAYHEQHNKLKDEDALAKLFALHGVSEEDFRKTFNSFFVDTKVRRARALSKEYGIDGVPTMVVNGKYRTSGTIAGGQENVIAVVDYLIGLESGKSSEQAKE